MDLEDLLFHPLCTTKPFKLAQIFLGSLKNKSRRSICPPFMHNKTFYPAADFGRELKKWISKIHFSTLLCRTIAFMFAPVSQGTSRRRLEKPCVWMVSLTRTPWKNGSSRSVFLRGSVEPDCPSKCFWFLSNLILKKSIVARPEWWHQNVKNETLSKCA